MEGIKATSTKTLTSLREIHQLADELAILFGAH
jgi:hypothetical protein